MLIDTKNSQLLFFSLLLLCCEICFILYFLLKRREAKMNISNIRLNFFSFCFYLILQIYSNCQKYITHFIYGHSRPDAVVAVVAIVDVFIYFDVFFFFLFRLSFEQWKLNEFSNSWIMQKYVYALLLAYIYIYIDNSRPHPVWCLL